MSYSNKAEPTLSRTPSHKLDRSSSGKILNDLHARTFDFPRSHLRLFAGCVSSRRRGRIGAAVGVRRLWPLVLESRGFPDSSAGKESTCNAGDPSSIPGSGRSGEGIGHPL